MECPCAAASDTAFFTRPPTAAQQSARARSARASDSAASNGSHILSLPVRLGSLDATAGAAARERVRVRAEAIGRRVHRLGVQRRNTPFSVSGTAACYASAGEGDTDREYAFEMAASGIRFGHGVLREIGLDAKEMGAQRVCVMTDPGMVDLYPVQTTLESLQRHGVSFEMFSGVRVEPNDKSFKAAIDFARKGEFDLYIAVGGGSVIDTCKAANLYASHLPPPDPENGDDESEYDFMYYVNPPIGKGMPPPGPLAPIIAVPTTTGTGSETTGVSIFDLERFHCKTGIAHRRLKPTIGILDPICAYSMPFNVAAASSFDVLSHAIESYTALPFHKRARPPSPLMRPAYQGSNPIADHWCLKALEMVAEFMPRSVVDGDEEARGSMMLASAYAGIGFGNAGVQLPHAMSYPVAGMARSYQPDDYPDDHPIVPHGVSVIMNAPAVFRYTSSSDPERHRQIAKVLGAEGAISDAASGHAVADRLLALMQQMKIPDGLIGLGYDESDIDAFVEGALPQRRLLDLAPLPTGAAELAQIYTDSLRVYK